MNDTPRIGARSALRRFLQSEAVGGFLLIAAAGFALFLANSPMQADYHHLIDAELGPPLAERLGPTTLHFIVNDALMAIFFLFVGLEIKREFVDGNLSTWDRRRLPVIAAAAGMAVPALIYLFIVSGEPALRRGWAIPAATDIAFAIGVLALLGARAPTSLKLFLTTVAIADDLGAVAIIALAYSRHVDLAMLAAAAAIAAVMWLLGRRGVGSIWFYSGGAIVLWYVVLQSGIHATVAGVLAAATVPLVRSPGAPDSAESPLHRIEHGLAPWVSLGIVPLFGFANAGVALDAVGTAALLAPLPLAIAAGLFLGKQAGIFGAVWLCVRFGLAGRLRGATWLQVYGVAMLCGIGFTMSLFIGALAFPGQPLLQEEAKLGILMGSLLSAVAGFLVLRFAPDHPRHGEEETTIEIEIAADGDAHGTETARK